MRTPALVAGLMVLCGAATAQTAPNFQNFAIAPPVYSTCETRLGLTDCHQALGLLDAALGAALVSPCPSVAGLFNEGDEVMIQCHGRQTGIIIESVDGQLLISD